VIAMENGTPITSATSRRPTSKRSIAFFLAVIAQALRTRRERPRNGRAAEQRDELAAFHVPPLPWQPLLCDYSWIPDRKAICRD
jgi:hypothetical protein